MLGKAELVGTVVVALLGMGVRREGHAEALGQSLDGPAQCRPLVPGRE